MQQRMDMPSRRMEAIRIMVVVVQPSIMQGGGMAASASTGGGRRSGRATAAFPPPSETSHDVDDNKPRRFSPNTTTNNGNALHHRHNLLPRRRHAHAFESYAQGLACTYLHAETPYLECAVRVAAESAEVDAESRTLSLVDDAFVLSLCSHEALRPGTRY